MADREVIAATLAAGLLQPVSMPTKAQMQDTAFRSDHDDVLDWAAEHAVTAYRAVLEELRRRGIGQEPKPRR